MHVARIKSGCTGKDGRRREYESAYLRRTYRDGGTAQHETLANLGAAVVSDEVYAAMDWLAGWQDAIKARLARQHLVPEANLARMALFDLSSSWLEGRRCPLAARD
jgi:hypothetical protein